MALGQIAVSAMAHAAVLATAVVLAPMMRPAVDVPRPRAAMEQRSVDVRHMVFLADDPRDKGSGGGGGGNRQPGPIRRAEGVGTDAITLRVTRSLPLAVLAAPAASSTAPSEVFLMPSVVLEAKSLNSGTFEQIGLPTSEFSAGTSTGSGSGGGVGTGDGTGMGPGRGPGVGPGSAGGIGGGVYRAGGAVSSPRVITEVKPMYTADAMRRAIQGTVVLQLVVTRDGCASQIRVVRSLDPEGLDVQAIAAVSQWRFEPGRLAGEPVDVVVNVMLDFWIR